MEPVDADLHTPSSQSAPPQQDKEAKGGVGEEEEEGEGEEEEEEDGEGKIERKPVTKEGKEERHEMEEVDLDKEDDLPAHDTSDASPASETLPIFAGTASPPGADPIGGAPLSKTPPPPKKKEQEGPKNDRDDSAAGSLPRTPPPTLPLSPPPDSPPLGWQAPPTQHPRKSKDEK